MNKYNWQYIYLVNYRKQSKKNRPKKHPYYSIVSLFSGAEKWNAVIIGAGFSGLDMGIKLKEIGVRFTILEKS